MCSADGVVGAAQDVLEAIHVVGAGESAVEAVAAFVQALSPSGPSEVPIDNKYYRANVPLRTYESLECVPERVAGALVLLVVVSRGKLQSFDDVASWWAARKAGSGFDVEVPLIVAWRVGGGDGCVKENENDDELLEGVFAWSVEEGFELVHCAADAIASRGEAAATRKTTSLARETYGMERVREAVQHCRWSMAEMKDSRGLAGTEFDGGEEAPEGDVGDSDGFGVDDRNGPNWQRMNDDVLRAFARLAACGSDSEGESEGEELFSKLAAMLRK